MISEFLLDNESFSQNSLARSFLICALIFVGDFLRASVAGFFRQLLQTLLSSLLCVIPYNFKTSQFRFIHDYLDY